MTATIRLTMSQALVRYLTAQHTLIDGQHAPLIPGVFAIFGHGNVAAIGEALAHARDQLPTLRAHNEQAMAHAAIAFAKAMRRRQFMACTTSIGPGATNMVTAAALAHVNRLPVLLLPGDVFASRRPDPVLQQVENFGDPTVTANDCFRPVSRYWDRITRPEQLLRSLPQALAVLTDPAECGPVTLALPQDVQAEAWDYPASFFEPRVHVLAQPGADPRQLDTAAKLIAQARRPLIIAGGGVHYAQACERLAQFATRHGIPVAETQAGKGALLWNHPLNLGSIGVTGSSAANDLAAEADVIIAIGTRLQDFTTASASLFRNPDRRFVALNACRFDAVKFSAVPVQGDAARSLQELDALLTDVTPRSGWTARAARLIAAWQGAVDTATRDTGSQRPSDAQVLGAVNRRIGSDGTVVCAAGGLPGELHKLWRAEDTNAYHLEYGYSCMGYEIAGGLGVKLAHPERNVVVLVGDGSYLMMNSEIATSIALGLKLTIVLLDNRGFGCINRLQGACGGEPFNNLLDTNAPDIDFVAHARSLGAQAHKVGDIAALESALDAARTAQRTSVIVIDTDPQISTSSGGAWWDVAVPQVSESAAVRAAYENYRARLAELP
ncbi:MAG TPA: 3D-(3,5/4)-trihydroxycyclohexane-1,2-dione acylhydrolase (decyclizing) [Povalibacter sp.]|jgi:3D-(3,5/4)-trihydroxycyclohexane-1,2-dione acylhydrolase (decyclizing)|nr:3D-(3,5/4)-trihydroxycyclohexane-1,2-dione acylhydrolase (decyclizing) [Povalibacter sp.]